MSQTTDFGNKFVQSLKAWIDTHHAEESELGNAQIDLGIVLKPPLITPIGGFPTKDSTLATLAAISSPIAERMTQFLTNALRKSESPLETYMLLALVVSALRKTDGILFVLDGRFQGIQLQPVLSEVYIEPQAIIGEYRVDFLVTWSEIHWEKYENTTSTPRKASAHLVVECDGHNFHEKTKEQAARDKLRDRTLQECGYNVFRFTGSEIWQDTLKCADDAIDFIQRKAQEQLYPRQTAKHDSP
jgi:very-short-patch-repair endonuclease